MLWNPVITMIKESFIVVLMSGLIRVGHFEWGQFGSTLDSLLAILFIVITFSFPVVLYF